MKENDHGVGEKGNVVTSSRFLKRGNVSIFFIAMGDDSRTLSVGSNNLVVIVDTFLEESWGRKTTSHSPEQNYLSPYLAMFSSYIFLM